MIDFISIHKDQVAWVVLVIVSSVSLIYILKNILLYIGTKKKNLVKTFALINQILRVLVAMIAIALISYVFVDKKFYTILNENVARLIWILLVSLTTVIGNALFRNFLKSKLIAEHDDEHQHKTFRFIDYLASGVIYLIGLALIILAFPSLRVYAQSVLAGAGVFALGMGIAAQEAISNIINGLMIFIYRPFKIGDVIKIDQALVGTVEDITLRHTVIRNYQNKRIVVPNSNVNKNTLINYNLTDPVTCEWIEVGISYDADIDKAKKLIKETCLAHPNLIDHRSPQAISNGDPIVIVRVTSLGDYAVNLRAWTWAKDYPSSFVMKCDLLENIKKRFDAEGIEIPYPHRSLIIKHKTLGNAHESFTPFS